MPAGVAQELPAGLALELLLIEVGQSLRTSVFLFSLSPKRFDLAMDEALAVVELSDEGYSDQAAWWIAREASVVNIVDSI
jgi:hypothetical protein